MLRGNWIKYRHLDSERYYQAQEWIEVMNHLFSSEMTFGDFIVGLFNRSAFPYDRHLEFKSTLYGIEIGGLITDLVNRSSFELDTDRTTTSRNFSMYVYKDGVSSGTEQVVEIKIFRDDADECAMTMVYDLSRSFSPSCRIEIECIGYPF